MINIPTISSGKAIGIGTVPAARLLNVAQEWYLDPWIF